MLLSGIEPKAPKKMGKSLIELEFVFEFILSHARQYIEFDRRAACSGRRPCPSRR